MILEGHSFKLYLTLAAEIGTTFFFVMQQNLFRVCESALCLLLNK